MRSPSLAQREGAFAHREAADVERRVRALEVQEARVAGSSSAHRDPGRVRTPCADAKANDVPALAHPRAREPAALPHLGATRGAPARSYSSVPVRNSVATLK